MVMNEPVTAGALFGNDANGRKFLNPRTVAVERASDSTGIDLGSDIGIDDLRGVLT